MFGMLVVALVSPTLASADAATWPQWRGPSRDGIAPPGPPWPETLADKAFTPQWRVSDLGESYSGPIVGKDRVFVTGTVGKKFEVVRALDRATGRQLWQAQWEGAMTVPFFAARNGSWIRSTPCLDEDTLYVAGMRDVLVALDVASGKERWRVDFPKSLGTPLPAFGFVCSPMVQGDAVYVQAGASFAKLDKRTGKILWRTLTDDGGMMGSAFSSPISTRLGGSEQLVVQTRTRLAGVDANDGKVLWSKEIPSFRGMNILTPLPFNDGIFTSTYGGNTQWFPIVSEGGQLRPGNGWGFRYEGHMTSPVLIDGHAYLLGKDQRFLCVDLATGKECWRSEKRFGTYWNLVAHHDRILALDNRGILYLIKADPKEFHILDERRLEHGETWAHLAVCGEEVYIRDLTGLTKFLWRKP